MECGDTDLTISGLLDEPIIGTTMRMSVELVKGCDLSDAAEGWEFGGKSGTGCLKPI